LKRRSDVAVLNHVRLTSRRGGRFARPLRVNRPSRGSSQPDHLDADESAGDVGVNRPPPPAAVRRPQRPRTSLLFAAVRTDQPELLAESPHHLLERGGSFAKRDASSAGISASSASSLRSIPPGPCRPRQRFVVSGSSPGGKLPRPVGERSAASNVGPGSVRARHLLLQLCSPDFACFVTARAGARRDPGRRPGARAAASRGSSAGTRVPENPSSTTSSASTWRRFPSSSGPVPPPRRLESQQA